MDRSDRRKRSKYGDDADAIIHRTSAGALRGQAQPYCSSDEPSDSVMTRSTDSQGACYDTCKLLGGGAPPVTSNPGSSAFHNAYATLEQTLVQDINPILAHGNWNASMLNNHWSLGAGAGAWPKPIPAGGFEYHLGYGGRPSPFARHADEALPREDLSQRGVARKGSRCSALRTESVAKLKNREAQRRFRDRQKEKVSVLEEELAEMRGFRDQALAGEERLRGERATLSKQIMGLQAELSELHEREVAIAELAGDIALLRAGSEAGRDAALDELALCLGELQAGGTESFAEFCAAKLCLFVKPEDLSATDPALVLALRNAQPSDAAAASPAQLKLRLRAEGRDRVYSLAELMHLPPQTFVAIYDGYVKGLLAVEDRAAPKADRLACELRALLCCFSAVHPRESMMLQLRDGLGPAIRTDEANTKVLSSMTGDLRLSLGQLQRMRQAALTYARQQAQVQDERGALLRSAAMPLGCRAGASCTHLAAALDAEARLRRNLDMDLFSACRLTTHFLTDVLTTQQFVHLLAVSHPHPMNIVELVHCLDEALPAPDA